jgi:galacturan 1,4-alpha-galacturonidase
MHISLIMTQMLILKDISYWKSNGVQLTYQSAYTAWTIGGSGIHIYGGGTFNGSGDSELTKEL